MRFQEAGSLLLSVSNSLTQLPALGKRKATKLSAASRATFSATARPHLRECL